METKMRLRKAILIALVALLASACPLSISSFDELSALPDGSEVYTSGVFDVKVACLNWQQHEQIKPDTVCKIPLAEHAGTGAKSIMVDLPVCTENSYSGCIEPFDTDNSPPESIKIRASPDRNVSTFSTVRVSVRIKSAPSNAKSYTVRSILSD